MEQHEHRDVVTEIENFAIIFGLVCLASWILRTLYRPFRGIGWKGHVLGIIIVPLVIFASIMECISIASATDETKLESVTIKVPKANLRTAPKVSGSTLAATVEKGMTFKPAWEAWKQPDWFVVHIEGRVYYLHRGTLQLNTSVHTKREVDYDAFMIFAVVCYVICAYNCRKEQVRIQQELYANAQSFLSAGSQSQE